MGLIEALKFLRKELGEGGRDLSQRRLSSLVGPAHTTISNIESGKYSPGFDIVEEIISVADDIDIKHRFVHIAFNLPPPTNLGELDETLKELCDLAMRLSGEEREQLTEKIRAYLEARESLFGMELGGDAREMQQERPAKKAGHG